MAKLIVTKCPKCSTAYVDGENATPHVTYRCPLCSKRWWPHDEVTLAVAEDDPRLTKGETK